MSYENLDARDKEICEAIEAGKDDGELVREFGINEDKINQLRAVVAENGETPAEDGNVPATEGEAGAETPAEEGAETPSQPEGEEAKTE